MPNLIQKSGYVKGSGAGGYMKYISERENVEKLEGNGPASERQRQLIADLLRDFPDAKDLHEYTDYTDSPTSGNASAFITMALDANADSVQSRDGYMKYIATRPRVERHGEHGLFSSSQSVSLDKAIAELESHKGNVWTIIYSLRREDAERLGYDNAESWRRLINANSAELASTMKIHANDFRWYAAFHNEGHHPHIHIMAWSTDPRNQGYLTQTGISKMRSKLTNEIFRDELHELYQEKDVSYKELRDRAQSAMQELVRKMSEGVYDNPSIVQKMSELSNALKNITGKKVYKYLKKPIKAQVDAIVDELAAVPEVAECYEVWNKLKDDLDGYYYSHPRERKTLSQQEEFRVIKNMVIREAENISLNAMTFEDERMNDEPEPVIETANAYEQAHEYREATRKLYDVTLPAEKKYASLNTLERLYCDGFTAAAHLLGKVWRDGLCDPPDMREAEKWFRLAAEDGADYSQYALGKLLEERGQVKEALGWYERTADRGNEFAQYRLGKLYLTGEIVPKDVFKAIKYLTASAQQGNQYAQYTLGKIYMSDSEIGQNRELAQYWLTQSAAQGNQYAQFLLAHLDEQHAPSVLLSATKLMHHMANIIRDNSTPPANPHGVRIDSKRRRKLMEKRLAMGYKPDDHEEPERTQQYGQILR